MNKKVNIKHKDAKTLVDRKTGTSLYLLTHTHTHQAHIVILLFFNQNKLFLFFSQLSTRVCNDMFVANAAVDRLI